MDEFEDQYADELDALNEFEGCHMLCLIVQFATEGSKDCFRVSDNRKKWSGSGTDTILSWVDAISCRICGSPHKRYDVNSQVDPQELAPAPRWHTFTRLYTVKY